MFVAAALFALLQPLEPLPRVEKLDCGLTLVIVETRSLPLVSVQLWFRVGSADDPPGRSGMCQVVRLALEQRERAGEKLRAAGLRTASGTSWDASWFETVLPPECLDAVLEVEAARLRPGSFDEASLGAALANSVPAEDAGEADRLAAAALAGLFEQHPYGHAPGRITKALREVPAAEFERFAHTWFRAANATLFVIGDVAAEQAARRVRERFGGLDWSDRPQRQTVDRPSPGRLERTAAGVSARRRLLAWLTPPIGFAENAAIDVLMQQLANPIDGPLSLRAQQDGLTLRWERIAGRQAGVLLLEVGTEEDEVPGGEAGDGRLSAFERAVFDELAAAAVAVPAEEVHERNRALARAAARSDQDFAGRARRLAELEVIGGDILLAETELLRYARVSVLEAQRAAELLARARCVVVRGAGGERAAAHRPQRDTPPKSGATDGPVLGSAEALRFVQALPEARSRPPGAALASRVDMGRVALRVLPLAGAAECAVVSTSRGRSAASPIFPSGPGAAVPGWREDETREYLALNELVLHASQLGGRARLASIGPADRWMQMVEIHARWWQAAKAAEPAAGSHELVVVGDVAPERVAGWLKEVWPAGGAIAESTGSRLGGQEALRESRATGPRPAASGLRTVLRHADGPERALRFDLRIAEAAEPDRARFVAGALAVMLQVAALACGDAGQGAGLEAPQVWIEPGRMHFSAGVSDDERLLRLADALRTLEAPCPEAVDVALKVARNERRTGLRSVSALAELLQLGAADPWGLYDEITAQGWSEQVRSGLAGCELEVTVHGGGAAVGEWFARLPRTEGP